MKLSVAYTFEPGLIEKLARFQEVKEIFGKLDEDIFGGGRATYTLRPTSRASLQDSVQRAHACNITFNYLCNGATLGGLEQTKKGHTLIRRMLDFLMEIGVDSVTVASPFLLRMIKKQYPHLSVRASAFAVINSPQKARQWQNMGADTLCISAIACNRNFKMLEAIRSATHCELQLIVNASCLPDCVYELTHMNMLTQSSRSHDPLHGFCLDYCVLHCSMRRYMNPVNFIRSTWIRPEDLTMYEELGYGSFKILERSCPGDLLVKRVSAYTQRHFAGNLLEIVAPVAQIKKELHPSFWQRLRMMRVMFKPQNIKIKALLKIREFSENIIQHDFSAGTAALYIDNNALAGFLQGIRERECLLSDCDSCRYCHEWAEKCVDIKEDFRRKVLDLARELDSGLSDSSHWI